MRSAQFHQSAADWCSSWLSSVLLTNIYKLKKLHEVHCLDMNCILQFAIYDQISCQWRRNVDDELKLEQIDYTVTWVQICTYQQRWTSVKVSLYLYILISCKGCGSEAAFASDSWDQMWAVIFCSNFRMSWKEWVSSNNCSIIFLFKQSMLINFWAFSSCLKTKLNMSSSKFSLLISDLVK